MVILGGSVFLMNEVPLRTLKPKPSTSLSLSFQVEMLARFVGYGATSARWHAQIPEPQGLGLEDQ